MKRFGFIFGARVFIDRVMTFFGRRLADGKRKDGGGRRSAAEGTRGGIVACSVQRTAYSEEEDQESR